MKFSKGSSIELIHITDRGIFDKIDVDGFMLVSFNLTSRKREMRDFEPEKC